MSEIRGLQSVFQSKPTIEGAGVHLKRVFGFKELPLFDPFLLFDDFRSSNPDHYLKGFPWHPHRGIETITYVLDGDVEHRDSLGNEGIISAGDVQWMTAGSGIVHQEMPRGDAAGNMNGFQLWANLPSSEKMMNPRYRDIEASQIPEVALDDGTLLRVIAGEVAGVQGPMDDIVIDPEFLDITIAATREYSHPTKHSHTVFAYVIDGWGAFEPAGETHANGTVLLFGDGDQIVATAGEQGMRCLLISGRPLNEPIAWRGPIVMNSDEELQEAFQEYRQGRFIKYRG